MRTSAESFFYGENKNIMKKAKTIDEQLEILKERNLVINDYDTAHKMLTDVNYYTLIGYLFPYKDSSNTYQNGTSIELAINLYRFDNELRNILTALVVDVEEKLKTRVAYHIAIAHKNDPLIYTDINFFKNPNDHLRFMADFQNNIRNNREVPFVKHHIQIYRSQFPIWVAVNLFTLGNLKYLYKNIPSRDRKNISRSLDISPDTMDSWIDVVRILRNRLAHNMRIYDSTFLKTPRLEKHHQIKITNNKLFAMLVLLKYLSENSTTWQKSMHNFANLIQEHEEILELTTLGLPVNWQEILK